MTNNVHKNYPLNTLNDAKFEVRLLIEVNCRTLISVILDNKWVKPAFFGVIRRVWRIQSLSEVNRVIRFRL